MHGLSKIVSEKPEVAKKAIYDAFVSASYDWTKTAAVFGLHHQTLRKLARSLKITDSMSKAREKAIKRGELEDDNGRPRKPVPPPERILRAFVRNGCVLAETAVALGVTAPTLRRWIRDHDLGKKLAAVTKRRAA